MQPNSQGDKVGLSGRVGSQIGAHIAKAVVAGIFGGGLAEGANTLYELYLDLTKQATPVIEVGASKKVTEVISEGKESPSRISTMKNCAP